MNGILYVARDGAGRIFAYDLKTKTPLPAINIGLTGSNTQCNMDFNDNYLIIGGNNFFNTIAITVTAGQPSFTLKGDQYIGTLTYSAAKILATSYVVVGFTSQVSKYDLDTMNQIASTGFVTLSGDIYWLRQIS